MRETERFTAARSSDRPERPRASFLGRGLRPSAYVLAGAVAGAALALAANTMAAGGPPTGMAVGGPPEQASGTVWAHFERMNRKPLALFQIDQNGALRPHYGPKGTLEAYDPDMQADHTIGIVVKVSNPKTCWTTTTGDERCVVY